jgi:hypothetical protein
MFSSLGVASFEMECVGPISSIKIHSPQEQVRNGVPHVRFSNSGCLEEKELQCPVCTCQIQGAGMVAFPIK